MQASSAATTAATTAAAVRSAHEEVRRAVAASFSQLEKRQQRIAEFDQRQRRVAEENATRVADVQRELDGLLPTVASHALVAAENARLEGHRLDRDKALRAEDAAMAEAEQAHQAAQAWAASQLNTDPDKHVSMQTWFYAPACRTSLVHTMTID